MGVNTMVMKNIKHEEKDASIKSLESTYSKLSNAYKTMSDKRSNLTLVEKRRDAVKVGLDSLENIWNDKEFLYSKEEVLESREILKNLMPSIEKQIAKAGKSSPQKTVNERRLIGLELAVEALDNLLKV